MHMVHKAIAAALLVGAAIAVTSTTTTTSAGGPLPRLIPDVCKYLVGQGDCGGAPGGGG